jgi:eukaryotic-like serine/threonine-protein kinase
MDEQVVFGGKYTAVRRLDSGGLADTWEATGPTGQTVVVKSFQGLTSEQAAWLQQSAQAAAGVTSQYVARVEDWGSHGPDGFFLVREFIAGTDMGSMVASTGPLKPAKAALYGSELAAALAALHGHGVVHGNVKPANVLVTPDGAVKLVGVGWPPIPAHATPGTPATATMFTSPEQLRGETPTYESDVYGAGATLYSLSTGKYPFQGADAAQVAQNVLTVMPPAPARVNPAVPTALDVTIIRAMQKDPADRQGSAAELQQELQQESDATQVLPATVATPVAIPEKRRLIWPWIVGGVVLLALLAGGGWWYYQQSLNNVAVPNLTGMTSAQATATLNAAQLQLGTVSNTQSVQEGTPAGSVVTQDPAAGAKAAKSSKVNITLNGPSQAQVPNMVGQTEAQAIEALQTAGFTVGTTKQAFDAKVPVGNVISQDPAAGGQAPKGTTVTLTVSKGQQSAVVPDVTGKSQSSATSALEGAGFKVAVKTASSSSVAQGNVVSQTPGGGVTAVPGTTVTITVSSGAAQVKVPDVNGLSRSAASDAIVNVGLKVQTTGSVSTTATVNGQSPNAGTSVDPGSTVTITMGD